MNATTSTLSRRSFVKAGLSAGLVTWSLRALAAEPVNGIPYRKLGRTAEQVSAIGLGGFHIGTQKSEDESIRLIRTALDRGINFLDNCWDYNGGASEIRMGKALRDGYREKAFVMSKIDGRNRRTAAQQIDESLQRLQIERIDLMQMHEIIRPDDPDRIFAKGGAMEALLAARDSGKVRFIGFTGHKSPDIHLKTLKVAEENGVRFDTVQMPLNVMDAHFDSFEMKVLPKLIEAEIGVLGMKSMGGNEILKSGRVTPVECLHYALNLPTSVVITGCDSMNILEQAIEAAKSFRPLDPPAVAALLAKTAPDGGEGKFEKYKTSQQFDGTAQNPHWLG